MCGWQIEHAKRQKEIAAPADSELLAALKVAVRTIADLHGLDGWLFFYTRHPAMKQINAAIDKASATLTLTGKGRKEGK